MREVIFTIEDGTPITFKVDLDNLPTPEDRGWTTIGRLEFEDKNIPTDSDWDTLAYKFNGREHMYSFAPNYGTEDGNIVISKKYLSVAEAIQHCLCAVVMYVNLKPQYYILYGPVKQRIKSRKVRFKGQKGWFNFI